MLRDDDLPAGHGAARRPLESERGHQAPAPPNRVKLGLSTAVLTGIPELNPLRGWVAVEAGPMLHFPLGRFSVRLGVPLRGGASALGPVLWAGVTAECRLHVTQRFAIGLGIEVSASLEFELLPNGFDSFFGRFHYGPTATLASVRLGETLAHEVSLSAAVLFRGEQTQPGGFVFLKYAFLP